MVNLNLQTLQVAAVVTFYMSAALVMVFVNKAVLKNDPDLPLLFLFIQLSIAVVLLQVSSTISNRVEIPRLHLSIAKKLTPVILVNVIGLVFNTLCLRDVEASFFQASSSYFAASKLPGSGALMSTPDRSRSSASADNHRLVSQHPLYPNLETFHAVLIKSSLPHCDNSTIQLAWWQNAGSAVFLFPFVLLNGEHELLRNKILSAEWKGTMFIWGSIVTGIFGFLLCVAGLLSIKVTSPITHMFSSAARSVLQTILGVWIFHDLLNTNRASSILLILGGTVYYTWVKSAEGKAAPPRKAVDIESMGRGARDNEPEINIVVWEAPSDKHEEK
ncbi:hypothetical protein D9758_002234 [Tetrapyrgos nigripes]|uniref:GDP-mannose transporter n=1 Tax=Tetrapyrgos nigripes TaxID=182062 RepID=A0A8H5GNU3_9AGAR|nr:hypothetical protein D9758_002234 [Tetrapyrgos nigripes]